MNKFRENKGQIMLMSVLLICGAILGVSALASTLVLQQIKKSTATGESARAVFAAEAGIERALYYRYQETRWVNDVEVPACSVESNPDLDGVLQVDTEHTAKYTIRTDGCASASSLGESGRSARAFSILFNLCEWGQLNPNLCD